MLGVFGILRSGDDGSGRKHLFPPSVILLKLTGNISVAQIEKVGFLYTAFKLCDLAVGFLFI